MKIFELMFGSLVFNTWPMGPCFLASLGGKGGRESDREQIAKHMKNIKKRQDASQKHETSKNKSKQYF